jgi:hypothetical protein
MMVIGEPVLGPLTVPDLVFVVIGLIMIVVAIINKIKPPRPPALHTSIIKTPDGWEISTHGH